MNKIIKILKRKIFTTIIISALFSSYLFGSAVAILDSETANFFDNASYQGTMLSEDNSIRLAPIIDKIDKLDTKHVWKLHQGNDGAIYAATAKSGAAIYKMQVGETNFKPFISNSTHTAYTSITTDSENNIYAALGPNAMLQKYSSTGVLLWEKEIENTYIWDMKFDKAGNLLISTGGEFASVISVAKDGTTKELFKNNENHAVALYYNEAKNSVYIGTAGEGLVLELNIDTLKYTVVYDTQEKEVHAITVDKQGNIYFGTSTREDPSVTLPTQIDTQAKDAQAKTFRNSLYRADKRGVVQRLFYLNQIVVFALSSDKNDNIYFITGDSTDIYRIDNKTASLGYIGGIKDKTLSTFTVASDGTLLFAMSVSGEIYKMQQELPRTGQFTSGVIDLKLLSRFGTFGYMTDNTNSTVKIETRTGNISTIDNSWSDFKPLNTKGNIESPRGRFIQFRITLTTLDKAINPIINNIYLSYLTENIAPDILSLSLVTFNRQQKTQKDSQKRPQLSSSEAMLIWASSDQNGDSLIFDLFYRLSGEKIYKPLVKNTTKNYYVFNANKMPSGIYDFKVVASDKADNTVEDTLTREFEILNTVFDNLPPIIDNLTIVKNGQNATVRFRVYDELSIIRTVRYSLSLEDGFLLAKSDDGLIDSKEEFFTLNITDPNISSITIEVVDIEGNSRYYSYVIK